MPSPDSYRTPARDFTYEPEKVKGSRFIAHVLPVDSVEAAGAGLEGIRELYPDASHHCFAWRIGMGGEITRAGDDGEPGGSAGRPILAQLEGHELTNLVVVVVRYFGGTKLGVGGLMRAYGGAAGQALDRAPCEERAITVPVEFTFPYDCSGAVEGVLHGYGLSLLEPEYGQEVRGRVLVVRSQAPGFRTELVERTAGRVRILEP